MNAKSLNSAIATPQAKIFIVTWLTYAGFYFCRKNFSIAMTSLSAEGGWNNYDFAFEIGVYSIMYMAGQFLSGLSSDRFGAKIVVGTGLIIIIVANVLMGFANTPILLALLMGMNGLGQSTGWSGSIKILTQWTSRKSRGILMSWWTTCYVAGGFLAVIFATWWASNQSILASLSWKRIFWAPALLLMLLIPIFNRFIKNSPSKSIPSVRTKSSGSENFARLVKNLSNSTLWLAALMYFFVKLIRYTFLFWLPLYLTQSQHFSPANAGYTSAVFEIAGFAGILIAGFASDKVFGSRRFPVSVLMLLTLALVFMFQRTLTGSGYWGTFSLVALSGLLLYGPDSLISGATAMDIGDKETAGFAAGFINGIGSAGQLCSPFITAYVTERFGWNMLFNIFLVFALVSGLIMLFKWNFRPEPALSLATNT